MANKLALIIEQSDSYLSYQTDNMLQEWFNGENNIHYSNSLDTISGQSLFGDTPCLIVTLTNNQEIKNIIAQIEALSSEQIEDYANHGLIIRTSLPRTGTKKLEALCTKMSFTVLKPPSKGTNQAVELLADYNFNPQVRMFLLDYCGNDYEKLLPILRSLKDYSYNSQNKISVEAMQIRLPQPPGSIAPWEIEKPLFDGNISKTIELSRRISETSSHLVWLSLIKRKVESYFKVSNLLALNPDLSDAELATKVGLPQKGFYFVKQRVMKTSLRDLTRALLLITRTEAMVKGSSNAPTQATMEKMLIELCEIFSS